MFDTYLVSGNITVFCGRHTETFKKDILSSGLCAELTATLRGNDRESSWAAYVDISNKIRGPMSSRTFQRFEFRRANLLKIVEASAESNLPTYERQALASAFSQIKHLQSDSPITKAFLDKLRINSSSTGDTATLLTIVRADKAVVTLQVAFNTDVMTLDVLDQPLLNATEDGKTNIRLLRNSLDERKYSLIRDEIIKKLGNEIETKLLHIPQ
ncbi:MAG: hypothetical protein ACRESJ_20470 [Pseudomonas sp.]|uniref:hypothetical protein n=1 Tax=Pseudomonas sp. TaxID=306 RepID=UPI003D6DD709